VKTLREAGRNIPVVGEHDVVVCGGGPAGLLAAVAAARGGARTLLIERYGFLGGMATAGMMVEFGSIHDGERVLIGGITHEFLHRMERCGGGRMPDPDTHSMIFDPESMIAVCMEMAIEAGAELLLHSLVVDAICEDGRVRGVIVENKSGRSALLGEVIVDATGDGDAAVRAGADFRIGHGRPDVLQPVTLEVLLGNVDLTRIPARCRDVMPIIAAHRSDWPIPTERIFSWGPVRKHRAPDDPRCSFFFLNTTNALGVDGTNASDLTRAETETRRQVGPLIEFLRGHVSGFEDCYLDRTAAQVGVRESRRIAGDYELTREDVLGARHFDDGVVPACNSIDVHDAEGKDFAHEYLQRGTHYEIPYRCFLPAGLEGMLVAGRCLSADSRALGSARVMVVCMPMGEACGAAAALSAAAGCRPRELPVDRLRALLREGGTVLGE